MIHIRNLVIERSKAINNLSLDLDDTGCFAILGPNGAGKTTLINVICGLLKRDAGEVTVNGMDPDKEIKEIRKMIGLVTQETALYEYLTGRENLEFHAKFYGVPKSERKTRIDEALKLADLENRADDKVSRYSGGMKRRLALVRSLLHDPRIVILDEPSLGVDVISRNQIWDHINLIKKDKLVILNTNYMDEADRVADSCTIINRGEIITTGSPDNLKQRHAGGVMLLATLTIDDDELDRLIAVLRKNGRQLMIDRDDEYYKIQLPSMTATNELLTEFSAIVQQFTSLKILDLNVRVPSLDDVFMALTGKSLQMEE